MRLLRRIIFVTTTLLLVAVLALWVRSYWYAHALHWCSERRDHVVACSAGRLVYATAEWPNRRVPVSLDHSVYDRSVLPLWWDDPSHRARGERRWLLVEVVKDVYPYDRQLMMTVSFFMPTWDMYAIPLWPVAAVLAIVPARGAGHWLLRRRRVRRGLCSACGYDLRASTGRCPECGVSLPSPVG